MDEMLKGMKVGMVDKSKEKRAEGLEELEGHGGGWWTWFGGKVSTSRELQCS
jgi:hypothetical protein